MTKPHFKNPGHPHKTITDKQSISYWKDWQITQSTCDRVSLSKIPMFIYNLSLKPNIKLEVGFFI